SMRRLVFMSGPLKEEGTLPTPRPAAEALAAFSAEFGRVSEQGTGTTSMKTIGIVGGVAWPSSLIYYRMINELIAERLGGSGRHCAKLILAQADFDEVERCQTEGRWDLVGDHMAEQANKLKAAGADFYVIACNTVHTAAERIQAKVDLPFIHIVDP